jgi:hypothetical protein
MSNKLAGDIKIQLTPELRKHISKAGFDSSGYDSSGYDTGESRALPLINKIREISCVKHVWFTDSEDIDLLVEIEVDKVEEGKEIASQIRNMEGVKNARAYMSIPA